MVYNLVVCLVPAVLALIGIRKLRERSWGFCKNNVPLDNKVAVVTGANCGIGYEVAKELAARNADVILACRNLDAANKAIAKIQAGLKRKLQMRAMELDLASLDSIRKFASNVQKLYPEIHLLVNNAGVAYPNKQIHFTKDNIEIHFGVNHLGHFYLTTNLLKALEKSAPSRVVVVSSSLHEKGAINFDHLNDPPPVAKNLYANSKLANVYFCKELAKRTKGKGVNVYAVCPGWVYSSLFRHSISWYHYFLVAPIAFFFMRSPRQGAQTIIYCATDPDLANESGQLYRNCGPYESKVQFDDGIGVKLWEVSEKMIEEKLKLNSL